MRIIISIVLVVFFAAGCPSWLEERCVMSALLYPFFHVNLFHLIVNLLSVWAVFNPGRKDNGRCLLAAFAISVMVYPLSVKPIAGISNILFAVSGMRTPPLNHPWWKSANVLIYLAMMGLLLFLPAVSAVTHIASFIIGVGVACLSRWFNKLKRDVERLDRIG